MALQNDKLEEHATFLSLTGIFSAIFVAFASQRKRGGIRKKTLKPGDLALLAMATYRLGHLAANDKILALTKALNWSGQAAGKEVGSKEQ